MSIFTGSISMQCALAQLFYMIGFCTFFDWLCTRIEINLEGSVANSALLQKFYKELMILGFISFCYHMSRELGLWVLDEHYTHCFHFADMLVTLAMLFYIISSVIVSFSMHVARRNWDRISMTPTQDLANTVEREVKKVHASCWSLFMYKISETPKWREDANFEMLRLLFLQEYHLDINFDYMCYVQLTLENNVVALVNLTTVSWVMIIGINVAIYFAVPHSNKANEKLDAEIEAALQDVNATDYGTEFGRRQLGGAAAVEECKARWSCELEFSDLAPSDFNMSSASWDGDIGFDMLNTGKREASMYPGGYNPQCAVCDIEAAQPKYTETTSLSVLGFVSFAWFNYIFVNSLLWIIHRKLKHIMQYKNVNHVIEYPEHLRRLEKEVAGFVIGQHDEIYEIDEEHEQMTEYEKDDADNYGAQMMNFPKMGKKANYVMSRRSFTRLMFCAKTVQLLNCFYLGFYGMHMSLRITRWEPDVLAISNLEMQVFITVCMLLPCMIISWHSMPRVARRLSLLVGVLYLDNEIVAGVHKQMEFASNLRKRILSHLLNQGTRLSAKKRDKKKGADLLSTLTRGELVILKKIQDMETKMIDLNTTSILDHPGFSGNHCKCGNEFMDDSEFCRHCGEVRQVVDEYEKIVLEEEIQRVKKEDLMLTRSQVGKFMKSMETVSTDAEWKKFLSREPHTEGPVKEKKGHSKTTMSARSMVLSDVAPADDQIMLQEFRDFVGLSVFKALKTVQENDDDDSRANNFRKGLAELGLDEANQEKFDMLAKVVKIFSIFDRDGSGSIDYDELRKALSAYRVPVTKDELSHIYRVIDPDQSGFLDLEEWINFMTGTESELIQQQRDEQKNESEQNAAKGTGLLDLAREVGEAAVHEGMSNVQASVQLVRDIQTETQDVVHASTSMVQSTLKPLGGNPKDSPRSVKDRVSDVELVVSQDME